MTDDLAPLGEQLLTVSQVAKQLNVHVSQVWRWVNSGDLPHVRLGPRATRFRPSQIDEFIDAHTITVAS